VAPLDPTEIRYLLTGLDPVDGTAGWGLMLSFEYFDGPEKISRLWRENRKFLMDVWRKQGNLGRPWGARFDHDVDGGTDDGLEV
jgi:hypothetical protein